ncbi:MAG: tRNA (adenosine(37)-N6)-threonylcarbamoyltransferase complex dimerization subunit type 1 TsaB [Planctomycetes bacterium]|nr:tRNA (adenosine(37)-N6)-threonylcarbamoyltransferase complex dimerization subunit type 1 TsaB [Planctomycetota bacterium]
MTIALAVTGSNLCGDRPFSAALRRADGAITTAHSPAGERGDLAVLCRELCSAAGVAPAQVKQVVTDVGPGSYTGLRVAVTFVRFLQGFGGCSVEAVDSLALLAHHALQGRDASSVQVMLDARRGRYHMARFAVEGAVLRELEPAAAVETDAALARVSAGDVVVAPAALLAQLDALLRERAATGLVAEGLGAEALFASGLPRREAAAVDLEPRYLMASYAG